MMSPGRWEPTQSQPISALPYSAPEVLTILAAVPQKENSSQVEYMGCRQAKNTSSAAASTQKATKPGAASTETGFLRPTGAKASTQAPAARAKQSQPVGTSSPAMPPNASRIITPHRAVKGASGAGRDVRRASSTAKPASAASETKLNKSSITTLPKGYQRADSRRRVRAQPASPGSTASQNSWAAPGTK